MKLKDYYDGDCARLLAGKLIAHRKDFDEAALVTFVEERLEGLEFLQRQDLFVQAFETFLGDDYPANIALFTAVLGPELAQSEGMFTQGYWLWPVGRYVEKHGLEDPDLSLEFLSELTKRHTGEFAVRPLISADPRKVLTVMERWSRDENVHLRRLASEGLRTRLPWARKSLDALREEDLFRRILTNLKDDPEKFVQKSVGNNLNDLMTDDPEKAESLIASWEAQELSPAARWIIKHGRRSQKKTTA